MSLVTRCPKCSSAFRVVADQLRLHDGLVRCGACSHVFDGFECLDSQLPTLTNKVTDPEPDTPTVEAFLSVPREPVAPAPMSGAFAAPAFIPPSPLLAAAEPTVPNEPVVMRGRAPSVVDQRPEPRLARDPDVKSVSRFNEPEMEPSIEPVIGEARLREPESVAPGSAPPPFMEDEQGPGVLSMIAWGVACLLAFVLLCLQVMYVYRNEIGTAIPSMRAPLNLMCSRLGCEVSYVRQLQRITFTASSLQQTQAAGTDGTPPQYLLKFSMRNRYDKPQPWPSLLLSLEDAGGAVVVRKMILPHEYLPRTLLDQPFAAGQELNLDLPLVVHGQQVKGFKLDKFFP